MSVINIFNKYYNIDYIFYMSAIDIFNKYYNIEYSILCQLLIYLLNTIPLSIYTICSHLYTLYMIHCISSEYFKSISNISRKFTSMLR